MAHVNFVIMHIYCSTTGTAIRRCKTSAIKTVLSCYTKWWWLHEKTLPSRKLTTATNLNIRKCNQPALHLGINPNSTTHSLRRSNETKCQASFTGAFLLVKWHFSHFPEPCPDSALTRAHPPIKCLHCPNAMFPRRAAASEHKFAFWLSIQLFTEGK